jgi:hypothetical protein
MTRKQRHTWWFVLLMIHALTEAMWYWQFASLIKHTVKTLDPLLYQQIWAELDDRQTIICGLSDPESVFRGMATMNQMSLLYCRSHETFYNLSAPIVPDMQAQCWLHYCPLLDPLVSPDIIAPTLRSQLQQYDNLYTLSPSDRVFLYRNAFTYEAGRGLSGSCVCRIRDTRAANRFWRINTWLMYPAAIFALVQGVYILSSIIQGGSDNPGPIVSTMLSCPVGCWKWCHPKYEYYTDETWRNVWMDTWTFSFVYFFRLIVSICTTADYWITHHSFLASAFVSILCSVWWIVITIWMNWKQLVKDAYEKEQASIHA